MTVRQLAAVPVPTQSCPGSIAPRRAWRSRRRHPPWRPAVPGRMPSSVAWAAGSSATCSQGCPRIGGSRPESIPDASQISFDQLPRRGCPASSCAPGGRRRSPGIRSADAGHSPWRTRICLTDAPQSAGRCRLIHSSCARLDAVNRRHARRLDQPAPAEPLGYLVAPRRSGGRSSRSPARGGAIRVRQDDRLTLGDHPDCRDACRVALPASASASRIVALTPAVPVLGVVLRPSRSGRCISCSAATRRPVAAAGAQQDRL